MCFPGGSDGKESACNTGDLDLILREDPLEKGMATHSSILAWRIPWTEEPGKLQFSSVQFSHLVMSDSVTPWTAAPSFPVFPQLPGLANSCPLSLWCHPSTSSSFVPFSSCPQSFPSSRSFPVSEFFTSGDQSIGDSASASVLPMNSGLNSFRIDWFDLPAVQGTLKSLL